MALLFLIGRLIFGGFFIYHGLDHFLSYNMLAHFTAAKGVPAPGAAVVVAGLLILFGGVSIVVGWRPDLGITAIAAFLIAVTPVMHDFWAETGAARTADLGNFWKNIALLGAALMFVAIPRPWAHSVEAPQRGRLPVGG